MKKKSMLGMLLALGLVVGVSGCTKPEIAIVLEDYCAYQKSCDYAKINKKTQYHDLASCDKFHKDMLNKAADGAASGCRSDVEDFFIDFMNAQMSQEPACSENLMTSLNRDETTQVQLTKMLKCIKDNGNGDTSGALNIAVDVIGKLELDLRTMKKDVCINMLGTFMGEDKKALLDLICAEEALAAMTPDGCVDAMNMAVSTGAVSFTADQVKGLCSLFQDYAQ